MDIKDISTLEAIYHTLNNIEIKGRENIRNMSFAMDSIEQIWTKYKPSEDTQW